MKYPGTIAAAALAGLVGLAGCATGSRMSEDEKLAIYQDAAGEPVKSFHYFGSINGWTPLDDMNIAVWTRAREAWLLTFDGRCNDAQWASAISVTDQGGRVFAGFDKVIPINQGISMPCRIQEIRPLDTDRIRSAEKAARETTQESPSGT